MARLDVSRFDAALVDLDGTMVDTLGDFVVVLDRMLADLPAPFSTAQVRASEVARLVGKGSENLIKAVLTQVLAAQAPSSCAASTNFDALYPLAWQRYQHHYQLINGQFAVVYPGVLQGLQQLRAAGKRLACLTNKPTAFAQVLLRAKGLEGFFDVVYGGDAFERRKPDPLPLLKACEALGCQPQRTLMIGDSSNDAQAARAAGCPVWLVRYGYNHGQPIDAVPAEAYLDSLAELATA
jgi:phosphoglycolate phosphatase